MRNFFEPATASPAWLRQVLNSIRAALGDIWPAPLRLKDYAAADLPSAADFAQGLAYNITSLRIAYSNGSAWVELQGYDATLAGLAALDGSAGILTETAADTFAKRILTPPAAGLTISNPAGTAGNPTFALANDLAALEALSGTNTIYYRSGADTWTGVTIGGLLSFSGGVLNIGDAELAALGGLTSAADKIPYFNGSGTAAVANFTPTARSLVDDTSVTAMRVTLGFDGNIAVAAAQATATFTVGNAAATTTSSQLVLPRGGGGTPGTITSQSAGPLELNSVNQLAFKINGTTIFTVDANFGNFASDAAAAAGSVPVKGLYRNGSVLMFRVS